MKSIIQYVDVDSLEELTKLDNNKRYLEFLGGKKKYRCFIVDKNMPRCNFYKNHLDLLEKFLHPIFKNRGILIAQDNTFPLPGFYIISYDKKYNSIDELPDSLSVRTAMLLKKVRYLMRTKLEIEFVNIYYEEKKSKSNNVHYWIMPKNSAVNSSEKLYELDLKKYLSEIDYLSNKNKIIRYNKILKKALIDEKYKKIDDELYNKLEHREKKINLCISKRCFMKCKGCYNNFCSLPEISFENIEQFLKYAKAKGLEKVTLSGGDPLTRDDISDIINKCLDLKLKVNMDTVGLSLIDNQKVVGVKRIVSKFSDYELLSKLNSIGIPLDGSNNKIISEFRIYNGNLFDEIIKVLNILEKRDIKVCINTVLHKQNKVDMNNILKTISKYKCIKKWQVFQFMSIGTLGKKNENMFNISLNDFKMIEKTILQNNNSDIKIEFKSSEERSYNYMLINSNGDAYKVDLNNQIDNFGNISNKKSWQNIMNNLF